MSGKCLPSSSGDFQSGACEITVMTMTATACVHPCLLPHANLTIEMVIVVVVVIKDSPVSFAEKERAVCSLTCYLYYRNVQSVCLLF